MSLWIRSQNKYCLRKVDGVFIKAIRPLVYHIQDFDNNVLAEYKTEKRALEILNDIQAKLKNKYLAKANPILNQSDFKKAVKEMEEFNNIDLIGSNCLVDIQPINPEVIVYEMPEK